MLQVTPGSPAHRIGLGNNDHITHIGDAPTNYLKHQDAQHMMQRHGETMILTVERYVRHQWGHGVFMVYRHCLCNHSENIEVISITKTKNQMVVFVDTSENHAKLHT